MRVCEIEGCERKHEAHGLCKAHYKRRAKGQPLDPPFKVLPSRRPRKSIPEVCTFDGCQRKHHARDWCSRHYWRWKTTGSPDGVPLGVGGLRPLRIKKNICGDCGIPISKDDRPHKRLCKTCAAGAQVVKTIVRRIKRSRAFADAAVRRWRRNKARPSAAEHRRHHARLQRVYSKTPKERQRQRERNRVRRALRRALGNVTKKTRVQLLEAQKYRCQFCAESFTEENPPHMDHILPVSRGGRSDVDNLQMLCARCNMEKGAKTHVEYALSKGQLL